MTSISSPQTSSLWTITTVPPLAQTTPFIAPQGCANQFRTTSFVTRYQWDNYTTTTVKVLASDPGDPRFSACQPSGWNEDAQFQFSPAVCPSGFTAYDLGAVVRYPDHKTPKTFSTAYCCSSGFTIGWLTAIGGIYGDACLKHITESTTGASSIALEARATATTSSTPVPNALSVHNPWKISWEASDIMTLSPSPPVLKCTSLTLSSWVPGETVDPGFFASACPNDGESHWSDSSVKGFFFMVIGLPIIGFLGIVTCIAVCCCRRRRRKRAKARAKAARQPPATSVGTTSLPRE